MKPSIGPRSRHRSCHAAAWPGRAQHGRQTRSGVRAGLAPRRTSSWTRSSRHGATSMSRRKSLWITKPRLARPPRPPCMTTCAAKRRHRAGCITPQMITPPRAMARSTRLSGRLGATYCLMMKVRARTVAAAAAPAREPDRAFARVVAALPVDVIPRSNHRSGEPIRGQSMRERRRRQGGRKGNAMWICTAAE